MEAEVSDSFVPRQLTDEEKQQALVILHTCRTLAEADLLVSVLQQRFQTGR
jgi:hypothetical protein